MIDLGNRLPNYTVSNPNGTLVINKRPITITADAKFKCFGSPDPALTAQVTAGTIVSGDVSTGSLVRASGETGGTYLISKGSYTYGSNYAETYIAANFVINPQIIAATFNTNNNWLFFGYSGDQTATITAKPSGGVGPYKVKISMNRPLKCNFINDAGDEKWLPSGASSSANNTCTGITYPSIIPLTSVTSSTWNVVSSTTTVSLSVTLMQDAIFTLEITDASGCVFTKTGFLTGGNANGNIDAEDVRCFAGNSSIQKVTICHRTGSTKNPCVTICVDESAVAEHMAHGDYLGSCLTNCAAPVANARIAGDATVEQADFTMEAYPNPFKSTLSVQVTNPENREVNMQMLDLTGRPINLRVPAPTEDEVYVIETDHVLPGMYFIRVNIGKFTKTMKLLKE